MQLFAFLTTVKGVWSRKCGLGMIFRRLFDDFLKKKTRRVLQLFAFPVSLRKRKSEKGKKEQGRAKRIGEDKEEKKEKGDGTWKQEEGNGKG